MNASSPARVARLNDEQEQLERKKGAMMRQTPLRQLVVELAITLR